MKKLLILLSLMVYPIIAFIHARFAKKNEIHETSLMPIGLLGITLLVGAVYTTLTITSDLKMTDYLVRCGLASIWWFAYFALIIPFARGVIRLKDRIDRTSHKTSS